MRDTYVAEWENLPNADIVYDKFQILRQLRHVVNQVRMEEAQDFRKSHPVILWKTSCIYLINEKNLMDKQQVRLKDYQRKQLKHTRMAALGHLSRVLAL
jgi:transposase